MEQRRNASGGYDYFLNNNRFADGYMVRSFAIKSLAPVEGVPDVDELQRFNQAGSPPIHLLHAQHRARVCMHERVALQLMQYCESCRYCHDLSLLCSCY